MTNDADATVLTQFHRDEELADFLLGKFVARRPDARAFALRNRVLLCQGQKLNVPQIFEELVPLAELKEDSDIVPRLETMMRKRGVIE